MLLAFLLFTPAAAGAGAGARAQQLQQPAPPAAAAPKPHFFYLLIDDYGFGNAGWHNVGNPEVVTPNLNALVASGVEMNRNYV